MKMNSVISFYRLNRYLKLLTISLKELQTAGFNCTLESLEIPKEMNGIGQIIAGSP